MAGSSFQNEIPKSRVNIQLSVDKGSGAKKMELPLKMVVLGDFTNQEDESRISEREKININKNNFNQVMDSMNLGLQTNVENKLNPDGGDLKIDLNFKEMKSFSPEEVAKQIPEIGKLIAARNLIRDLGSNLLDNREFRKRMEGILKDQNAMESLMSELDKVAPLKADEAAAES
jgi:type VI secretion system protein ImpB